MGKLYIFLTIVITLCIQTACSGARATDETPPKASPEQISAAFVQAKALYQQRPDVSKLRDAVDTLSRVRDPQNRNFEVEWQYAKYCYFLGIWTKDQSEAEAIFAKGHEAGKIASRMEPNRPEGFFWYGANLGEEARLSPVSIGIKSVDELKAAMNKVIEIDPTYQNSNAYDALAQLELATRVFGTGTAEKAAELLRTALERQKDNGDLRLHLAEALISLHKETEAKEQLEEVLKMKPDPEYLPEHETCVNKAKKLLETKF